MDHREMLIRLWHHIKVPADAIAACSRDYDLLCPHCRMAGLGDVHLKVLPDNTGFLCAAAGHRYRAYQSEMQPFTPRTSDMSAQAAARPYPGDQGWPTVD